MFVPFALFPSLIAQAATATAKQPTIFESLLMPLSLILVMTYFVLVRPQQKRTKDQQTLISSARSGDEIVTSGGLHGIISNAHDPESRTVLVKFAENVKIEVDKSAITSVTKAGGSPKAALPAGKTA